MRCPFCEGDLEPIALRSISGEAVSTERCTQCSGFWFPHGLSTTLNPESVAEYDRPQPNFSLQSLSLICPIDQTVLQQTDHDIAEAGAKSWSCPDCGGLFFPKGQLALITKRRALLKTGATTSPLSVHAQGTLAVLLLSVGSIAGLAAYTKVGGFAFQAATTEPLPTAGPNILTLVLLALAYLAGTVLAVLGRRLAIIFLGWGVIAICLAGFSLIIFGP